LATAVSTISFAKTEVVKHRDKAEAIIVFFIKISLIKLMS